jgi:SsuE family FMN reductase
MATIATIVGSPSSPSRTAMVVEYFADRLREAGHAVSGILVRELPAQDLVHGRFTHNAVSTAVATVTQADAVVVATPIYKASFSGVLKIFLDALPQHALRGKPVQPLGTAGTAAHVLAIDYALRTVLVALGAEHIEPAYVDVAEPSARFDLTTETTAKLDETARRFVRWLQTP